MLSRIDQEPETKGQFGKFVGEWEDSFKVLYICVWCELGLVKTFVSGKEWGTSSQDNKLHRPTFQGRQDFFKFVVTVF